jgi:HK97 family phage prohead protease
MFREQLEGATVEHHSFSLKVKGGVDDAGKFSGLLASFNTVDLGGDKILPGAFTKTLAGGKSFPLLWQHDSHQPIGSFKGTETSQGLSIEGQLILSIQTAANARELLRHGVLKGLSIGYDAVKSDFVGDVRELSEIRLWEGSIVTFPMNESAQVTGVKALSDDERLKHLKGLNEDRKAIDRHQRSQRMHLKALFDVPDDDDIDDPELEGENDSDDDKALLVELRKLADQAAELASK